MPIDGGAPGPVETVAAAALAAGVLAVTAGHDTGDGRLGIALTALTSAGGFAASVLLVVGALIAGNRSAGYVAAAVTLATGSSIALPAGGSDLPLPLGAVAVLGVAALLRRAVTGRFRPARDGVRALAVGSPALLTGAAVMTTSGEPPWQATTGELAWAAVAVVAATGILAGGARRMPLVRRAGLAFLTEALAHLTPPAGPLHLAATAMIVTAACPFLAGAVRAVGRRQAIADRQLAAAEATVAVIAQRDHELRNVVAGLSGAASVLQVQAPSSEARTLLAATGTELARLQRLLSPADTTREDARCDVVRVVRDLVTVHRASGLPVRLVVDDEPCAAIGPSELAHVVANLLVNCARHAPGADVLVRVARAARGVRIEVIDSGPGLPAGRDVCRSGVRGPGSTGDGLGLAIITRLVDGSGGTFGLRSGTGGSGAAGCTATVDLPHAVSALGGRRPAELAEPAGWVDTALPEGAAPRAPGVTA